MMLNIRNCKNKDSDNILNLHIIVSYYILTIRFYITPYITPYTTPFPPLPPKDSASATSAKGLRLCHSGLFFEIPEFS